MKMQTMLFMLFIVLSIVPLLIFGISSTTFYSHQLLHVLENELSIAASTQIDSIDNFLNERDIEVSIIGEFDVVHDLLNLSNQENVQIHSSDRSNLDNILKVRVDKNEYIESITLTDAQFRIVACSQWVPAGEVSILKNLDSKYHTPELQFTEVFEENQHGNTEKVLLATKQIVVDGNLLGYIVEEINLNFFEKVRLSANLLHDGTIYLIDGKGQLITAGTGASSRQNFVLPKDKNHAFTNAWNARDKFASSGILDYKIQGEHYITYYSGFEHAAWNMLATISVEQNLHTQKQYSVLLISLLFIVLLMLLAVNYIISARIVKPLDRMIHKFKLITETKDYSIRMELADHVELGTVSAEINTLLEQIEHNIDEEKNKQRYLRDKAEKDPLTGLLNKSAIEDAMRKELTYAQANGNKIIYLFIDLDDFKNFNSNYGHAGGDKTLCFLADTLRWQCQGISGRIGGDEFAVCIINPAEVEAIETLVRNITVSLRLGVPLGIYGQRIPLYCCIGGVISNGSSTYEELMKIADDAMYQVKENGKNGHLILDSDAVSITTP
ncbi:MAG: sensor domain-containing diguanylate cyclase [Lachnospiraceae bacterium]